MGLANVLLFVLLVLTALWMTMTRSVLRSAIGLALASVLVAILMFRFNASLAAVFELSVCAGLIPVLFISTISLTQPLTQGEIDRRMGGRYARFLFLPMLILVLGAGLALLNVHIDIPAPSPETTTTAREVLWNVRGLDVLGQIIILIAGVFGVVVLFKEKPTR
jgi:NADH-quinone oxidoreductase subunit J